MNPQIDESQYQAGYADAWDEYRPDDPVGDPVGVHEDYQLGWWCAVGEVSAWHEGWEAASQGALACPYLADADDECFREPWYRGYWACVKTLSFKKRANLQ